MVEKELIKIEETSSDLLRAERHSGKAGLWLSDALLLCLEHLQIFGLILSLSLLWPWPQDWIRGMSFTFLLNLDFWEFAKVHTVYSGQQQAFPDPLQVPLGYLGYSIAWIIGLILAALLLATLYKLVPKVPFLGIVEGLLLRAKLVRFFTLMAQVLCLPFGLVLARLFHCQNYPSGPNAELVFRSIVLEDTCWSSSHLGLLIPMLIIAVAYFIVLPCWMVHTIIKQLLFRIVCTPSTWDTHENYIRLKEAEYVQGLDISWETKHFTLFSSFARPWVWFRPLSYAIKGILLAVYSGLFYLPTEQAIVLFAVVCCILIVSTALPVYRLHTFNFMLSFSLFVNLCNTLVGMLLVLRVQSPLLLGVYLLSALIVINITWFLVAIVWIAYLVIRNMEFVTRRYGPLWPTLNEINWSGKHKSNHTLRYFEEILAGRKMLEKCYSGPVLFAPVHKLSHHIHVVNIYCREAEALEDPTHPLLWALLTEMIDVYNHLLPLSVYGASRTDTVLPQVRQLMCLMPEFVKRLEQREYYFILWVPQKQRILLKLLAVAIFLDIARKSSSQAKEHEKKEPELVRRKLTQSRQIYMDDDNREYETAPQNPLSPPLSGSSIVFSYKEPSLPYSPADQPRSGTASRLGAGFKTLETITEKDSDSQSFRSYQIESSSSTDKLLDKVNADFDQI